MDKEVSELLEQTKKASGNGSGMIKIAIDSLVSKKVKKASVEEDGEYTILNDYFRLDTGTYKILRRNVQKGVSCLLLGPTGVGKSELAYNLALTEELPCTIFDMGTMSDPIMSLVGTHAIKIRKGKTESKFIASRFSEVIQHPGVVVLDELSRASPTSNNLLFPVLDFRKELSMEYSFDNAQPVKIHPQCVFIATANVGSQYGGTHKLDRALIDRFMLVEVDALSAAEITKIINHHYPSLDQPRVNKMVNCYVEINRAYDECQVAFSLSLRHLKLIAGLVEDGFTIYDSFYCICKGIGSKEGLKSLETILGVVK